MKIGLGLWLRSTAAWRAAISLGFLSGTLDPRITFTRASTGTYFDAAGVMQTAAVDVPRFDHDPVTLQPKGLLIEGARTNVLLGSAAPVTQNVTVTAQIYTLSFYGTGSIALSGVHVATLVGTGATNRVTLAFTPTAGTLTLTVTGSVTVGQLEAGAFASSPIVTTASSVTRAADVAVMTGANFSSWYNASEGAFVLDFGVANGVVGGVGNLFDDTQYFSASVGAVEIRSGAAISASLVIGSAANSKVAWAYKVDDFAACRNGGALQIDALGPVPVGPVRLAIGSNPWATDGGSSIFGHIRRLDYYRTRLPNSELQRLTA